MKTYDLYLESGPMMKKTMVHVPSLMGCTARGDTTQAALDATPDAIRAYLRFLDRAGETAEPAATFRTTIALHITKGTFLGNGSVFLPTDEKPLGTAEAERLMARLAAIHQELRRITSGPTARRLDHAPTKGRPIRKILAHICVEGAYLRGVSGSSRLQTDAENGVIDPLDALDRLHTLELERLRTMDADERGSVIMRGQSRWTVRSAVRKMLEHAWEHYCEIAVRLGVEP